MRRNESRTSIAPLVAAALAAVAVAVACGGAAPEPAAPAPVSTPDPAPNAAPADGAAGTSVTAAECEAAGGEVVGDVGDGAIHRATGRLPLRQER
jgi:hypothetical protein